MRSSPSIQMDFQLNNTFVLPINKVIYQQQIKYTDSSVLNSFLLVRPVEILKQNDFQY